MAANRGAYLGCSYMFNVVNCTGPASPWKGPVIRSREERRPLDLWESGAEERRRLEKYPREDQPMEATNDEDGIVVIDEEDRADVRNGRVGPRKDGKRRIEDGDALSEAAKRAKQ